MQAMLRVGLWKNAENAVKLASIYTTLGTGRAHDASC